MFRSCQEDCAECGLYSSSPLEAVPRPIFEALSNRRSTVNFKKGEALFLEGDPAHFIFCIQSGEVQNYRASQSREHSFGIYGPGTWIGYRCALLGIPHSHNARCLTAVRACRIESSIMTKLMDQFPGFARRLAEDLARGWEQADESTFNLGTRNIRERLADYILAVAEDAGGQLTELSFPLTRETLASLLGATTESVIRALSDFRTRGWVELHHAHLTIKDKGALQRLVSEA